LTLCIKKETARNKIAGGGFSFSEIKNGSD